MNSAHIARVALVVGWAGVLLGVSWFAFAGLARIIFGRRWRSPRVKNIDIAAMRPELSVGAPKRRRDQNVRMPRL